MPWSEFQRVPYFFLFNSCCIGKRERWKMQFMLCSFHFYSRWENLSIGLHSQVLIHDDWINVGSEQQRKKFPVLYSSRNKSSSRKNFKWSWNWRKTIKKVCCVLAGGNSKNGLNQSQPFAFLQMLSSSFSVLFSIQLRNAVFLLLLNYSTLLWKGKFAVEFLPIFTFLLLPLIPKIFP